jgi:3'-5' exoribonuclease
VATLRDGEAVDALFACTRKDRAISRSGQPYLTVELRDSSGSILGRAFREADVLSGRFEQGELVRVRGRVERFREQLQLEVSSIASAAEEEVEPSRFLPASLRDLDELEGFLEHLVREVYDPGLRGLLARVRATWSAQEVRPLPPAGAGGAGTGGSRGRCIAPIWACSSTRCRRDLASGCAVPPPGPHLLLGARSRHKRRNPRVHYGARIERSARADARPLELGLRVIAHVPSARAERRLALGTA